MKNRCQVFEKSIGLYIIVLIMLFYSCSEDKGNYDYKAVNEVIVTGVTKDTSVMRGEVLNIHPVIGRSLQASEEGLEYSWSLAGKEIGTSRDLAYSVPETLNVGKYDCRYVVTDTKNGMKYFVDFNVFRIFPGDIISCVKNPTSPLYCHISHRKKGLPSVCMLLKSETMHWGNSRKR